MRDKPGLQSWDKVCNFTSSCLCYGELRNVWNQVELKTANAKRNNSTTENLLAHFLIEILVCLNPRLVQFFSDTSSYPTFVLLFLTFFKTMNSLVSIFLSLIYQIYCFLAIKVSIYLQQPMHFGTLACIVTVISSCHIPLQIAKSEYPLTYLFWFNDLNKIV